jgi:hypothetical protein
MTKVSLCSNDSLYLTLNELKVDDNETSREFGQPNNASSLSDTYHEI